MKYRLRKLLDKTLPLSDLYGTEESVLDSFIDHAIFLYNTYEDVKALPEDIFLHDVFYPRVGTEKLVDCRRVFYDCCKDMMSLSPMERALEINKWCGRHVSYQTSDARTESPLVAFSSGWGRCGEESVFTVSVLRSMGIPARQVYVPFWNHTNDNHAWVEFYADGEWHFLGACEPEPIADLGWFNAAAARAPLVHTRTFFPYSKENTKEVLVSKNRSCYLYNETARYTKTRKIDIQVLNQQGKPAAGCKVRFYLVNYSTLATVANLETDEKARCSLTAGNCSYIVEAVQDELSVRTFLDRYEETFDNKAISAGIEKTSNDNPVTITLVLNHQTNKSEITEAAEEFYEFRASAPVADAFPKLTEDLILNKQKVLSETREAHSLRQQAFAQEAEQYSKAYPELKDILVHAYSNQQELLSFYTGKSMEEKPAALALLRSLSIKDYKDVTADLLNAHFHAVSEKCEIADIPFIMSPRIENEELTDFRPYILSFFDDEQKKRFRDDPVKLYHWIQETYYHEDERHYPVLRMTPQALLKGGKGHRKDVDILFVAILRTLGIAARLNPFNLLPEYRLKSKEIWLSPVDSCIKKSAKNQAGNSNTTKVSNALEGTNSFSAITITSKQQETYEVSYTLTQIRKDGSRDLLYPDDMDTFKLLPGNYEIVQTRRLQNGNQLVRITSLMINKGETRTICLKDISVASDKQVSAYPLSQTAVERYTMYSPNNESKEEQGNKKASSLTLLLFLEASAEPSAHILNEMIQAYRKLQEAIDQGLSIRLIEMTLSQSDPLAERVKSLLPDISITAEKDASYADILARNVFGEPGTYPFTVLVQEKENGEYRGRFSSWGYSVGTVDQLLSTIKVVTK